MTSIAGDLGWVVIAESASQSEVVSLCERHQPELVILDLDSPAAKELSVVERIHRAHGKAKIVILGSFDRPDTIGEAQRRGAADVIVKPFNRQRFIEVLNNGSQHPFNAP